MDTDMIRDFWERNPCGQHLLKEDAVSIGDFRGFFLAYDEYRYRTEPHILANLDRIDVKGKKILEIGIGQGADAQRIIERGGIYHGIDITQEACSRLALRCRIFEKPYTAIIHTPAETIPFPDNYFDIVYSHGVLHHIPKVGMVAAEIERVLKKGGTMAIMVYARRSLNYYLSILLLRRILLAALYPIDRLTAKRAIRNRLLREHLDQAQTAGLWRYLSPKTFLSRNTDGPHNPYSRVYTPNELRRLFPRIAFTRFSQHFLHERHLPLFKLCPGALKDFLAARFGWHLWAYGEKR